MLLLMTAAAILMMVMVTHFHHFVIVWCILIWKLIAFFVPSSLHLVQIP